MPRIAIEQKHTYSSETTSIMGTTTDESSPLQNIQIQFLTYPDMGIDENDRVGRKIRSDYITYETYYMLNTNYSNADSLGRIYDQYIKAATLAEQADDVNVPEGFLAVDYLNTLQRPLDMTIREMFVEFDREFFEFDRLNTGNITMTQFNNDVKLRLHDWYDNLVVQTANDNYPSNRNQIKRESTEYTGNFSILKDKIWHFSHTSPTHHEFDTIKYVRNMNFEQKPDNAPVQYFTAPSDKVLVRLWIGPYNYLIDYGNLGFSVYIKPNVVNGETLVCTMKSTMKLSYTDV